MMATAVVLTLGFALATAFASVFSALLALRLLQGMGMGRRPGHEKESPDVFPLSYDMGSSISGTDGDFFWSTWGWEGVAAQVLVLIALAFPAAFGPTLLPARRAEVTMPGEV